MKLNLIGISLLTASVIAASLGKAEDLWPAFRGPAGDGKLESGIELPLRWTSDLNVVWKNKEVPGEGWSSPVVSDDTIFLTAAIPIENTGEMQLALLAYDLETGESKQQVQIFDQPADAPGIHSKNSHASPTIWLAPSRIFAHFGHQGTAAMNRSGEIVWTNRDLTFPPVHGNGGSPVLVNGRLIFTCDGAEEGYVAALDAKSGKLRWRTNRPVNAERKFSFCTPTEIQVNDETQVICPGSDCVLALDPEDGNIIWQVTYDGYSVVPKPVYADGLVFIATGFGPTAVLAIDPSGKGDITDSHVRWRLERGAPKTPSLLADRGLLYVISDDGIFTVVEAVTGEQVYRQRIGGKYSASPILADNKIFLTSEEGVVRVVRPGREFQLLAENDLGEQTLATPAIANDSLIIRTQKGLYRISSSGE